MTDTQLTAKRITTFLHHLGALVESLPTREQKELLQREIAAIIAFLEDLRAQLAELPIREDEAGLEQSLKVLRNFIAVAEADPLMARTLGLTPKQPKARSGSKRPRTPPDHSAIVDQLKGLSPDEMYAILTQRADGCTVAALKQVALLRGLRVESKASRSAIVDQIVKRAENQAGYQYLREHA